MFALPWQDAAVFGALASHRGPDFPIEIMAFGHDARNSSTIAATGNFGDSR
jgi:hypothetical protein